MATRLLRVAVVVMLLISAAQLTYAISPSTYPLTGIVPDRTTVIVFQSRLQQAGYYYGRITGVLDLATAVAIARFQTRHGLLATGGIDQPTAQALGINLSPPYMGPAIP